MRVWGQLGIEGVEARWIKSVRCHVSGWVRQRRISIAVSQVKDQAPLHQIDGSNFSLASGGGIQMPTFPISIFFSGTNNRINDLFPQGCSREGIIRV